MKSKVYGLSSFLAAIDTSLFLFKKQGKSFIVLCSITLSTGCYTMQLPDYEARSSSSYKHVRTQNKLTLAINPLTDKQEIENYFGMDLLSANIFPVLVVAENNNPVSSFITSKDRVFLRNKNEQGDSKRADLKGASSASSGEALAIVGAVAVAPVLMFAGGKMISDSEVIKHNLAVKELQIRTISPGKSIQGFVYFQVPKEAQPLRDWTIIVEAVEIDTNTVNTFEFNLN